MVPASTNSLSKLGDRAPQYFSLFGLQIWTTNLDYEFYEFTNLRI
jgi:hypothetical protein